MAVQTPAVRILLLSDFERRTPIEERFEDMRRRLKALPGFEDADVDRHGVWSAMVHVHARNATEKDRLKTVLKDGLRGWTVVDEQSYRLP